MSAPLSPAGLTSEQVHRQLADFYARDWKELALDTGLFYYAVPTSNGGKPVTVLTQERVPASDIVPYMRQLGVTWFRWRGAKIVVQDDTRLRKATAAAAADLDDGQELTTTAIAEKAGVSDRQVRRWIKLLGVEVRDWLEGNTPDVQDSSAVAVVSKSRPPKPFWEERQPINQQLTTAHVHEGIGPPDG